MYLKLFIMISSFLLGTNLYAESTTYEWRSKDGGKVFTDRPPPKGITPSRVIKTTSTGGVISSPGARVIGQKDQPQTGGQSGENQGLGGVPANPIGVNNQSKTTANPSAKGSKETCDTLFAAAETLANSTKPEDQQKLTDIAAQYKNKCEK